MTMLRRALFAFALVWGVSGTAIALVPRIVLIDLFDQIEYPDYAYVRVCGLAALALALLAVLISRRLDAVWWWSWTFAITTALTAAVTGLNALVSVPKASGSLLWWLFAASNLALAAALLLGIARTARQKPFV